MRWQSGKNGVQLWKHSLQRSYLCKKKKPFSKFKKPQIQQTLPKTKDLPATHSNQQKNNLRKSTTSSKIQNLRTVLQWKTHLLQDGTTLHIWKDSKATKTDSTKIFKSWAPFCKATTSKHSTRTFIQLTMTSNPKSPNSRKLNLNLENWTNTQETSWSWSTT